VTGLGMANNTVPMIYAFPVKRRHDALRKDGQDGMMKLKASSPPPLESPLTIS